VAARDAGRYLLGASPIDRRLSGSHKRPDYSSLFRFEGNCGAVTFFR
jgi:hypothetical protein